MPHPWPQGQAEFQESFTFVRLKKDTLFRYSLAKHLVLGLEKLNLVSEIFSLGAGKQEQQGLKNLTHGRYGRGLKGENESWQSFCKSALNRIYRSQPSMAMAAIVLKRQIAAKGDWP
jgi:hypothetical protein